MSLEEGLRELSGMMEMFYTLMGAHLALSTCQNSNAPLWSVHFTLSKLYLNWTHTAPTPQE